MPLWVNTSLNHCWFTKREEGYNKHGDWLWQWRYQIGSLPTKGWIWPAELWCFSLLHDSTYQTGQLSNTYTLTKTCLACQSRGRCPQNISGRWPWKSSRNISGSPPMAALPWPAGAIIPLVTGYELLMRVWSSGKFTIHEYWISPLMGKSGYQKDHEFGDVINPIVSAIYHLVMTHIAMENHHFL